MLGSREEDFSMQAVVDETIFGSLYSTVPKM